MSTQRSTVDHIVEQAGGAGAVSARAMFGEYALYCDGKVVGLICNDQLFLKATQGALALVDTPDLGPPYPGAKPHLVADALLDDPDTLAALVQAVWADVPMPKPRKPRRKKTPQ